MFPIEIQNLLLFLNSDMFLEENISTLTYATKASFITNCPVVNDDPRLKAIQELKKQVRQLS